MNFVHPSITIAVFAICDIPFFFIIELFLLFCFLWLNWNARLAILPSIGFFFYIYTFSFKLLSLFFLWLLQLLLLLYSKAILLSSIDPNGFLFEDCWGNGTISSVAADVPPHKRNVDRDMWYLARSYRCALKAHRRNWFICSSWRELHQIGLIGNSSGNFLNSSTISFCFTSAICEGDVELNVGSMNFKHLMYSADD